jgi:predicted SprT family Zn-dependent metalloprotease
MSMPTPETIVEAIQKLSEEFNVPMPGVKCNPRRKVSCYKPRSKSIEFEKAICEKVWAWSVVIHEFAHYLDFMRQPMGTRRDRRHHDRQFTRVLIEVIDKFYSERDCYFWHREYRSIKAMYPGYVIASKKKFDEALAMAVEKFQQQEVAA